MNFKPFYIKTKGITAKQAQDLFNLAVKNGAEGGCYIKNGGTPSYSGQEWTLSDWSFIGVSNEGRTKIHSLVIVFGEDAVELTYEEALLHVQGSASVKEKLKLEAGKTYKLIDKEGYLQELSDNYEYLEREFTGLYITLNSVDDGGNGWVGRALVISTDELEYFELVEDTDHVQSITPIDNNKPKLKVTKERPTSGQFIATWIYDGKPWSYTYKWIDGKLYTSDEYSGTDWVESYIILREDLGVWYTIIK